MEYKIGMKPYNKEETFSALWQELYNTGTVGKKRVYNIAASFDTETSSFSDDNGNYVGLCYIWMFGIGNTVVYGRDLDDFVSLINELNNYLQSKHNRLYVYVHFLKYDFAFIKKLFTWDEVFIRGPREPLYARVGNIEFRDSLVLAGGRGLEYIGKKILRRPVHKAVGDLDYSLLRTSQTPMTDRELHYCEYDIRVLNEYITEKIEDDGDITKIPYTNTGYVRNYVRNECFKNRGRYMEYIDNLTLTPAAYLQAENCFAGGAVGPNIKYVEDTVENVHSYDIKSSYPYAMVAKYFPVGYFEPVKDKYAAENLESLLNSKCCMFKLEVFGLNPKTDYCFPISESKCSDIALARCASGRVMTAAYIAIEVTELDYEVIRRFYDLDSADAIRISHMRIAPRGYLPKPIIESILKFFYDKTTLDGVEGKESEYMIAKNMLNAVYGMMVEKIVRQEYMFKGDFIRGDKDYVAQVIKYNNNKNRFLYYPWGVWVTAHARFRLYDAIYNIGDDWRYCDTDSVKFVGDHRDYFDRVNKEAIDSLHELSERLSIPMERIVPVSPSGESKYLGVWEHEWDAKRFKTLGAKRYLIELPNGDHKLTVAGTNKAKTLEYLEKESAETGTNIFELFNNNLEIPKEYAKRTIAHFVDTERYGWITDYTGQKYWYTVPSGIYMEQAGYTFGITEQMLDAIDWLMREGHYTESEI